MNKTLLVKKLGKTIPALTRAIPPEGIISVGSDSSATIELESETMASEQFVIVCEGGLQTLLCRAEGTEINGITLPKGSLHSLELHDAIVVGDYSITVETAETAGKFMSGDTDKKDAGTIGKTAPAEKNEIEKNETEINATEGKPAAAEKDAPVVAEKASTEKARPEQRNAFGNALPVNKQSSSPGPDKSLNDVLEGLKAEEKFYFLIENGTPETRRIYVESEEMWLGWSPAGECVISEDPADVAMPRAQIRKDWSGVVLYPLKNRHIWLNNAAIDEPHRLKNDDLLQMQGRDKALPDSKTSIKFHEPTALLVLDSILPKELPPPVSLDKQSRFPYENDIIGEPLSETGALPGVTAAEVPGEGRIFGYFTGLEILIMVIGILVAAVLIFLVLEYY